jgi:hypothetical protein
MITSQRNASKFYWFVLICLIVFAIFTEEKKPFLSKALNHAITAARVEYKSWQCGQRTIVEVCK